MSRRIGRYEIQAELGRGGFGQVFRAWDPTVGRLVAIKTLTGTGDPDLLRRFRNEAAAAGKLRHNNIVIIFDFGDYEDTPYLVMELLDGEDLERAISSGRRLTLLEQLDIIAQSAAGLHHAHSHGVVHRDIKPANIMLQRDGVVKIMDFGIALLSQLTAARVTPKGAMIGTLPYMAPEQFQGAISDSLTDIFAFGITCYRLLTGTHPFHAEEMGGLMYNILHKTPEPIRALSPECPEALEQAVLRMLAKDREARYQNMEDLRFDLEPVSVDLRKERLDSLLVEARRHISSNQLEQANHVVRQALEADPGNRTARELRESLQRQIRENEIRPRIAGYVSESREKLRAGEYESAIKSLESALHLDKSNPELQYLIAEARAAWDRSRQAGRLLEDARQSLTRGDITAAQRVVAEALAADPQSPRAAELQSEIRQRVDARDRERRLDEGLNQARRLLVLENFDEAIGLLNQLMEEHAQPGAARDLLTRATAGKKERETRQRLQAAIDESKRLLKQEQFEEAVASLARWRAEFPESPELRDLSVFAQDELRAQRQAQAIARASAEARALMKAGQYDRALESLHAALAEHPGANALRELTQEAASAKAAEERRKALRETEAGVRDLLAGQRYHEAAERITAFVRAYGESAELAALHKQVEQAIENQRQQLAVRQLAGDAQALLDQNRPDTATQILQRGTMQFPGDPELARLLGEARNRLEQQRAADAISKIISEAESLSRARNFERALETLDKGLRDFGMAERLVRCREATVASEARLKREQEYKRALEYIQELRSGGNLEQAHKAIDVALKRFPGDAALLQMQRQMESERDQKVRDRAVQDALEEAQRLIAQGDPESATQILNAAAVQFPGSPPLTKLQEAAAEQLRARKRAEEIAAVLAAARADAVAGRWEEATRKIEAAKRVHGADPELTRAGEEITAKGTAERDERIRLLSGQVKNLCASSKYEEAIELIRGARAQLGEDAQLQQMLRAVEAERESRKASIRRTIEKATALLDAGRAAEAIALLDETQPEFEALLRRARARLAELELERELAAIVDSVQTMLTAGRYGEAIEQLDRAILQHPGAARLQTMRLEAGTARERAQTLNDVRTFAARGDFDAALECLRGALQKAPASSELQELKRTIERDRDQRDRSTTISETLERARKLLKEARAADAVALLRPVSLRYPNDGGLSQLLLEAEEQTRRTERETQLAAARRDAEALLTGGKPEEALKLLNGGFPGERRVADLVTRAEEQVAWKRDREVRERTASQLVAIEQRIATARAAQLEKLRADARRIAAPYLADSEVASIAARIDAQIAASLAVPPPKRTSWKPAVGIAAGLAIAGGVGYWRWPAAKTDGGPKPAATRHIEVRTDPAGAVVSLGDRTCSAPVCVFDVPDGNYPVEARLKGYQPATQSIAVSAASAGNPTIVTLTPEPPEAPPPGVKTGSLTVKTGVPIARVLIDGLPRGLTGSNGEFHTDAPAGSHTVRVEKAGYRTPSEERVVVGEGSSASVVLQMAPLAAHFEISDAPAGVEVRTSAGALAQTVNGRVLSVEVQPGDLNLVIVEGGAQRQIARRFEPGTTVRADWRSVAPEHPIKIDTQPKVDVEAQDWERARASTDPAPLEAYLRDHPTGPHAAAAQSRLDDLAWGRVAKGDVSAALTYLSKFPRGAHTAEAEKMRDDAAWAAVDKSSADTLQAFATQNPSNPHRAEAQAMLDKLRKDAEQQNAKNKVSLQEKQAILAALQRFNDAYLHKNTRELKQVWPTAPDDWVQAATAKGNTYFIPTLGAVGEPVVSADRATIRCDLTTQTILRGQPQPQNRKTVLVTLRKSGDQWIIENPSGQQ